MRFQRDRFKLLYEQRDQKLAKIPYFWSSVVMLIIIQAGIARSLSRLKEVTMMIYVSNSKDNTARLTLQQM